MSNKNNNKAIAIVGTTASGKTGLGVDLARDLEGEIVSADSRQVYKGMDVGTGKDLDEYSKDGKTVAYHLIDVAEPKSKFDVAQYKKMAYSALDDISGRGKLPIVVGGSGQYLEAVIDNYEFTEVKPDEGLRKELENKNIQELYREIEKLNKRFARNINESDRKNKRRLIRYVEVLKGKSDDFKPKKDPAGSGYEFLVLGLTHPKEILFERIDKRLDQRLENEGMVEEVQELNRQGLSWQRLEEFGLEYKYIAKYIRDELSYEEMRDVLSKKIKKFAKRQMTWFKRWEKQGRKIHWVGDKKEAKAIINDFLGKK